MQLYNKTSQEKFDVLRQEFEKFTFECFTITTSEQSLNIVFHFSLDEKIHFKPETKLPFNQYFNKNNLPKKEDLNSIAFHMGLIELISYWKAACPKTIHIKPYNLTIAQQSFWRKIYYFGLGEFFHTNKIEINYDDFFEFSFGNKLPFPKIDLVATNEVMIPIGGGKDSVVSLEIIKGMNFKAIPFIINPRGASWESALAAGYDENEIISMSRSIDPQLLKLNQEGYLNGHTPFSAMLAFSGLLAAHCCKISNMALSNEASANEPTVIGTDINHQYSKSFEFETDFRNYVHQHISPNFNYYSLLRPLSELQIAALFSKTDKYNKIFKSCNVGSKNNVWCCQCSKCLFTYIILSAFLKEEKMIEIFGENLFQNEKLIDTLLELSGQTEEKPFECVGTIEEVNIALCQIIRQHNNSTLPLLLEKYSKSAFYQKFNKINFKEQLKNFNPEHYLSEEQFEYISKKLS